MLREAWILVAALSVGSAGALSESAEGHLVILHTNDVHGQAQPRAATWLGGEDPPLVGGLPRLAAAVRARYGGVGGLYVPCRVGL